MANHFDLWDAGAPLLIEGNVDVTEFDLWHNDGALLILDLSQDEARHASDTVLLALFRREASYGEALATWNSTTACTMRDFDNETPHETWDDLVEDNEGLLHEAEYPTVQEIVRQSVRLTYTEPRVKPNTLTGLLGLALGTITSTQDVGATAYRHKITPASPVALPSINAQVAHMGGILYQYTGLKVDSFTLRNSGAYLSFACPLIGSGTRLNGMATDFAPAIDEKWLRWGDSHIALRDVSSGVLAVPTSPVQGATNLGSAAIDVSTRVLRMEISYPNTLWAEGGYRASTGRVRGNLLAGRRRTDLTLELQMETDSEARDVGYYLEQTPLAFEWRCTSSTLIAPTGTFYYGALVLIPKLQLRALRRSEQDNFDTVVLEGRVLDDKTNPVMVTWIYNAQATYLQ